MSLSRAIQAAALVAFMVAGAASASDRNLANKAPFSAEPVVIAAAGDAMFDRGVSKAMAQRGEHWPFSGVTGLLGDADITFLNLETSVTDRGRRIPGKGIWFRMKPERIGLLKEAGVDIVSIANNHIMDYDEVSLIDTMKHLGSFGIDYIGSGTDLKSARMGRIISIKGFRIGFLAYSDFFDIFWSYGYPRTFAADKDVPGIAPAILSFMKEDIRRMKTEADFVVVSMHWGQEYQDFPDNMQKTRAHAAIDAGADVVIGHHPHVLQPAESYNGGLIFYSLGNFIFDQAFGKTQDSALVKITLSIGFPPEAEFMPLRIEDGRPIVLSGAESRDRAFEFANSCRKLGTMTYLKDSRVYLAARDGMPGILAREILSDFKVFLPKP